METVDLKYTILKKTSRYVNRKVKTEERTKKLKIHQ